PAPSQWLPVMDHQVAMDGNLAQQLAQHRSQLATTTLANLVSTQPEGLIASHAGLHVDMRKNFCTGTTLALFSQQAQGARLSDHIAALFGGALVNTTERRPALHVALRASDPLGPRQPQVSDVLRRMQALVTALQGGRIHG